MPESKRDARFVGVDLAWRDQTADLPANETGLVVIDRSGAVLDACWRCGVRESVAWVDHVAAHGDVLMFVDAPLVVRNESGQRMCETQVGQRYGTWNVSANSTNRQSPRRAGVSFLRDAEQSGWRYSDGRYGPPRGSRFLSETYPYTVLVGAPELGYVSERPRYKRKLPRMPAAEWRSVRAANCDDLIGRLRKLADADPPLLLDSHPITRELTEVPSPTADAALQASRRPYRCAALRLGFIAMGPSRPGALPSPRPAG
jgi:hypothetical protein